MPFDTIGFERLFLFWGLFVLEGGFHTNQEVLSSQFQEGMIGLERRFFVPNLYRFETPSC